jgi:kynurenine formamidase
LFELILVSILYFLWQILPVKTKSIMKNYLPILALAVMACRNDYSPAPARFTNGQWIDLTYSFSEQTLYWPSVTSTFHLDTIFDGTTDAGFYYSAYAYSAPEHGGTHLDAPVHFAKGKMAVADIPLEQLTGMAIVIDVSSKALANADYQISIADVEAWEATNGNIPDGAIVLFKTGFGQYYPDAQKYLGTTQKGAEGVANLHFPGISAELAQWLVSNRKIKAMGLDTASVDHGQSKDFKTHQILYAQNICGFENVANLDALPTTGAYIVALPMKIQGGSGAPLRIVAWVGNP